jgi:hypothetical protein
MPDYKRTQSFYDLEHYPYTPNPSQIDLDNWEREVTQGGVFHQDPKHPEIVYPLKIPLSITRYRLLDGNEYLVSKQKWIGVNSFGDTQHRNVSNVEYYEQPEFDHQRVEDKNNPRSMIVKATGIRNILKIYTLTFSPENADSLYNMVPQADRRMLNFAVKDEAASGIARAVKTFEEFRNKTFDELYNIPPLNEQQIQTQAKSRR